MSDAAFDIDAFIGGQLQWLGLELTPESLAATRSHLETAMALSKLVREFPLDDEAEPAPVFTP